MNSQCHNSSNNRNILCRFFEAIASFWTAATNFGLFVILAAVGLLIVLLFLETKTDNGLDVVLNMIIFSAAAVGGFVLFKVKGTNMAAFGFAAALLIRLVLVFVLETSTPCMFEEVQDRKDPWIRHYDTVMFQPDEFFYVYHAQKYSQMSGAEFVKIPEFKYHAYRASFLLSKIFDFFGNQTIWPRVIGAFLGAITAAIICLIAQDFFSKPAAAVIAMLAVIAPQTVFYSSGFLKEVWVIFGASLMLLGFAMIIKNKRQITAVAIITAAAVLLMWFRIEYGLMFVSVVPLTFFFRSKRNPAAIAAAVMIIVFICGAILAYQFGQFTDKAEKLLNKHTTTERKMQGRLEPLNNIYKSRGPLRLLNIPLTILNPPPKNLSHIYRPENGFYDLGLQANIYQWWLPLPFLIIGSLVVVTTKREFLAVLLPYLAAIGTSALLLGGLQPNLLRYRDSLAPIAFIIIGLGIDSLIKTEKTWKNMIVLSTYIVGGLLAIYFCVI